MPTLKQIVEEHDSTSSRVFDLIVQALIVLSLVSFSIETLPGLSPATRRLLRYIEILTIAAFTIEYLLRLMVADRKLRFIFSFYGVVDLVAILPFYLALGLDLRCIRALRILQLSRVMRLARYHAAAHRFRAAYRIVREELILFFFAATLLLYLSAVGMYYFEHQAQPEAFASVFHGLWWAVVTLTTVGYGDVYPITTGGRVFTGAILLIGLGIIAVPTGLMASALSSTRQEEASSNRHDSTA